MYLQKLFWLLSSEEEAPVGSRKRWLNSPRVEMRSLDRAAAMEVREVVGFGACLVGRNRAQGQNQGLGPECLESHSCHWLAVDGKEGQV